MRFQLYALDCLATQLIVTGDEYAQNKDFENANVLADEVWLGQILVNLLTNAISATQKRENKRIWISIEENPNSHLCIKIKDNGVGIEENNLPHIFEPFFTTKASSKGLGLGLSISFNLAKEMNGSLSVKNLKTEGAEFTLCLPLSEAYPSKNVKNRGDG